MVAMVTGIVNPLYVTDNAQDMLVQSPVTLQLPEVPGLERVLVLKLYRLEHISSFEGQHSSGRLVGVAVGVAIAVEEEVEWCVLVVIATEELDLVGMVTEERVAMVTLETGADEDGLSLEQDSSLSQNMETSVEEMKSSLLPPTSA